MHAHRTCVAVVLFGAVCWLAGCGTGAGSDPLDTYAEKSRLNVGGDCDGSPGSNHPLTSHDSQNAENAAVEICHIPPGNPENRHTITVSMSAVLKHLAHGDYLGPCTDDDGGTDDSDGDGVADEFDMCPGTPEGDEVYDDGCTVIVLAADAGPDVAVTEGETVSVTASGQVVQGDHDEAELVFSWEQVDGEFAEYYADGPLLTVHTAGLEGMLTFLLTVDTSDYPASATDELTVTVVPPQIVGVTAGTWHNILLMDNGTIRPWGWGRYGQLGDGSLEENVADADAGPRATLLADTDGAAWTFGANVLSSSAVPVQVGEVPPVVQVGAFYYGGILLAEDGTVWGFGVADDANCELAGEQYPDESGRPDPVQITNLPEDIVAISTGSSHAVALAADGTAWVWGSRFGCTPWQVLDGVTAVAAGKSASCLFVREDGTAWGIGYNNFGQLGDGTTVSSFTTPTQALGLTDVVDVAAGDKHSLFLQGDGTLWTSGWNRYCQLGLEDAVQPEEPMFGTYVTSPTQVGITDVTSIAGGHLHSVAVRSDNTVWAWGSNSTGRITDGTLTVLPNTVCTPVLIEFPD